ncbi:hypothetical protein D3C84_919600 [compost metagenome]
MVHEVKTGAVELHFDRSLVWTADVCYPVDHFLFIVQVLKAQHWGQVPDLGKTTT